MHLFLFCVHFVEKNFPTYTCEYSQNKALAQDTEHARGDAASDAYSGASVHRHERKGELIIPYGSRLRIRRYFAKSEAKA